VERAQCDRDLFVQFGAPSLSGMAQAGVFEEFWRQGLFAYDRLKGIEWAWLSCDGAIGKAPLGGEQTGPNPTDRAKRGRNARFSAKAAASRSGSRSRART
jgi:hypothetical protein